MLNVGIISCWHVHTNGYVKELLDSGKVNIAAMWNEDAAAGEEWAARQGIEFIPDYDAFLAREDIDAVICNSPTTMHPELLSKAAKAGKHIFTEKLLATNMKDSEMLCKVIGDAGVTFTISLPLRADAIMRYVKQMVENGVLSRISAARMRRSHSGVSENWLPKYWFDTAKTGGGAMMDLGAHPVYMMSWLFGEPKRLCGMTTNLYGTSGDENAIAMVEFDGGIIGTCETAFVTNGLPDILEIYGSDASLFIRGKEIALISKDRTIKKVDSSGLPAGLPSPLLQFVDACIAGTGSPEDLGLQDALLLTKITEATYASDSSNTFIQF